MDLVIIMNNDKRLTLDLHPDYYVSEGGLKFTPLIENGHEIMSGFEVYEQWLKDCNISTTDPRDLAIAQLMRDVATLKGGAAHV